ncbi:MAG: PaaI family thioesterase [Flavobacteriaceae bacterium]|nr:PaaI family thioesterase [Flavobacteriaceae bacterium]
MNKSAVLKRLNASSQNTLMQTLKIEYIDIGEDFLTASMPVSPRVHQPDGVLHGGATVALAETVGSAASHVLLGSKETVIRGIEISANHLKSVTSGIVHAKAVLTHKGKTLQLWDIEVRDEENRLISKCKLSTICLKRR